MRSVFVLSTRLLATHGAAKENQMKRIVFLAGLPGVGKSTLARKIAEKVGGSVLDIDKIKKKIVDPNLVTSTIDPPEVRWACYEKATEEIFALLDTGASPIIVDEVFHLQSLRQKLEILCAEKGAEILWIEVRCSYEKVEKRLRASDRKGHILSTEEALKMNRLFEQIFEGFPDNKANCLTFNNEDDCNTGNLVPLIHEWVLGLA